MKKAVSNIQKTLWLSIFSVFFITPNLSAQDGEALFNTKCAMCHTATTARLVGPGLGKVNDRRDQDWLIKFVQSSQDLINSGDEDAIALFEEYNKVMMPDQDLSEGEVIAILSYLKSQGELIGDEPEEAAAVEEMSMTSLGDMTVARKLFRGETAFANGGPGCITCHNVNNNSLIPGGDLAKDLSESIANMGAGGVRAIIKTPSFPVMAKAYEDRQLTDEEVNLLTEYLFYVSEGGSTQTPPNAAWGVALALFGSLLLLGIAMVVWINRKKNPVNQHIFKRQIQSI